MASGTAINVRVGRAPKWLAYTFDQCAEEGFKLVGAYIKKIKDEWDTLSLPLQAEHVTKILPLILKRIPDKQEILQLSYNVGIDQETGLKMLDLANRNLLLYKDLDEEEPKPKKNVL